MDVESSEPPHWLEADRLEALADAGILDTAPEQAFDDIVFLVKTICRTPVALVSLVDAGRQWFKARVGTDVTETAIDTSVCALAIRGTGFFEIRDLSADPRTRDFSLVRDDPRIRFYAGVPLVTAKGLPLGSLCAIDVEPRPEGLMPEQREALEALARQTIAQIEVSALFRQREMALAASSGIGTWDWDVANDRVTADARFAEIYGVDPDHAARGAPIAEFFRNIHPDDLPAAKAAIDRALATGEPFHAEYRLRRPNGAILWVLAQGRPMLDLDGRAQRFPGVSFDITERRPPRCARRRCWTSAIASATWRIPATSPSPPARSWGACWGSAVSATARSTGRMRPS